MTYLKGVLIGLGTVLVGTPIALIVWLIGKSVWWTWQSRGEGGTVSFSPLGLANHLSHAWGFWILVVVLFAAGFVPCVFLRKR